MSKKIILLILVGLMFLGCAKKEQPTVSKLKFKKSLDTAENRTILGMTALMNKKYKFAEENFKVALMKDKNYAPAWYGLGLLSVYRKQPQVAIKYFVKSLKCDPTFSSAYYDLAMVYINFYNNFKVAEKILKKGVEKAKEKKNLYRALGYVYKYMKKFDDAIVYLRKYVDIENDLNVMKDLMMLYYKVGMYDEAFSIGSKIFKINPRDRNFLINYALVCKKNGKNDLFERYLKEALLLDGGNLKAFILLAKYYKSIGMISRYKFCKKKALAIDPVNEEVKNL